MRCVVVGLVGTDHVPAGAPHGLAQLGVQRLGALGSGDPHDLAGLHALAAAEGEVDEHRGVALEDLLGWGVGHGPDLIPGAPDARRPSTGLHVL